MACEVLTQRVLALFLAQVVTPPDGGADPDTRNADDHDDDENDPLIVGGDPVVWGAWLVASVSCGTGDVRPPIRTQSQRAKKKKRGGGDPYQPPPPLLLFELELVTPVLVDPSAAVEVVDFRSKACTLEHMLLYQLVMLPKPSGVAAHAASQGPAVVVEKAARRVSEQKQSS